MPALVESRPAINLDLWPHPLTAEGRNRQVFAIRPGETVASVMRHINAPPGQAVFTTLDNLLIERADWDKTRVRPGQVLQVRARVHGGDNDSNPLAIILTIALIIAAPYAAAYLSGGAAVGSAAYSAAYAGVVIVGSYVINQIAPPRLPDLPDAAGSGSERTQVYSIAAGSNRARLHEPMMLVMGTHRVFPDLGAREYTEIIGRSGRAYQIRTAAVGSAFGGLFGTSTPTINAGLGANSVIETRGTDQYLAQIFDFGLGDLNIADVRIGETPLGDFNDIATVWSDAANHFAQQTLVAGNVDSTPGAELTGPDEIIERETPDDTTLIVIDLVGSQGRYDDRGDEHARTIGITVQWRPVDAGGSYHQRNVAFSGSPRTPIRQAVLIDPITPGRYRVRVWRNTEPSTDPRIIDNASFSLMKSFQPDRQRYPGRTRLAMRIRASGQLNGRISQLTATLSQRTPVWNGNAWGSANGVSSNPAAILRWYARGIYVDGDKVAGVGLADSRIDHDNLGQWYQRCATLGLECNHVLTSLTSHNDVINLICQAGDASPTWGTGKLGVVWADVDDAPSALFTPGNIIAGTFGINYGGAPPPSEIAVRYLEPDNDWQLNTIRRAVPGAAAGGQATTITLQGVTRRAQAVREANQIAARQTYHRRRITFEVAAEHLAILRGDVAYLSEELVSGGQSGRLRFVSSRDGDICLRTSQSIEEDFSLPPGIIGDIIIRVPDGTLHATPVFRAAILAPDYYCLILGANGQDLNPFTIAPTKENAADHLYTLYRNDTPPLKIRIVGIEPRAEGRARITAIDEVPEYYQALAGGLGDDFPATRNRSANITAIHITETLIRQGGVYAVRFFVQLAVQGDFRGAVIRVDYGNGFEVVASADASGSASWVGPESGTITVAATPGSEVYASGAEYKITYPILGKLWPPATVRQFLIFAQGDGTREFTWAPNEEVDIAGYRIRYLNTTPGTIDWADMTPLHEGVLTSTKLEVNNPPAGIWTFAIKAVDTSGVESVAATFIAAELPDKRRTPAIGYECEDARGWPGPKHNGLIEIGKFQGYQNYAWNHLSRWDTAPPWHGGTLGTRQILQYQTPMIDIGAEVDFSVDYSHQGAGDVALTVVIFQSAQGAGEVAHYEPGATLLHGRYVRLIFKATRAEPANPPNLCDLCWSLLSSAARTEYRLDTNSRDWARGANGGRVVPTTLSLVTDMGITLQNVGAGWSSTVLSKAPPEIALYNAAGRIVDAVVDVTINGIP